MDVMKLKLGRKAPRKDLKVLKLENYTTREFLQCPATCDWGKAVSQWGMMDNDKIGDCTCAGAGHLIMDWTANAGHLVTPSDQDIITAYTAVSGYDPQTGANDNGAMLSDVLKYWQNTGIAGHKIGAYIQVNPQNLEHMKAALYWFGGLYTGVALPNSAQNQIGEGWYVVGNPNTQDPNDPAYPGGWGGHCVPLVSYGTGKFPFACVTWGQIQPITNNWLLNYMDEAFAILSMDFFNNEKAPNGLDIDTLQKDLQLVGGQ